MPTCATCAHCDTQEASWVARKGMSARPTPGACTKAGGWFNGDLVLDWFAKGCPDYQPAALPQADGDCDPGDCHVS